MQVGAYVLTAMYIQLQQQVGCNTYALCPIGYDSNRQ